MPYVKLAIPGDGVTLDGAAFWPDRVSKATVIICHGLPRGLPEPDDSNDPGYPGLAQEFVKLGYAAVIFNFRGTGESTGSLEIARWPSDLISVLDHISEIKHLVRDKYAVVGFSAGGAAAITAASADDRINPLVACAAPADFDFLNIETNKSLYFEHYRSVGMIKSDYGKSASDWVMNFILLEPRARMPMVTSRSVMILHGMKDDTVPPDHADLLADLCPSDVTLVKLEKAGHQLRKEPDAVRAVLDYLDRSTAGAKP